MYFCVIFYEFRDFFVILQYTLQFRYTEVTIYLSQKNHVPVKNADFQNITAEIDSFGWAEQNSAATFFQKCFSKKLLDREVDTIS